MILYLLMLRAAMIAGVAMWLAPTEILFDSIESELERRGVQL